MKFHHLHLLIAEVKFQNDKLGILFGSKFQSPLFIVIKKNIKFNHSH